jgi:hypothetical protein
VVPGPRFYGNLGYWTRGKPLVFDGSLKVSVFGIYLRSAAMVPSATTGLSTTFSVL